jgi:hypothetical protein
MSTSAASDAGRGQAPPGFAARGRLRRRARFLRKARELAYRDLGGLVFSLHRFGQRNDALVLGKLDTLGQIDTELRALEAALQERQPMTVLREAGITACPRCAAIHGSEDRFCPNCGLPISRHVDLPIAGPASAPTGPISPAGARVAEWTSSPSASPAPAPARTPAPRAPAPPQRPGATPPAPSEPTPATASPARAPAGASAPGAAATPGPATATPSQSPAPDAAEPAPTERPDAEQPTEIVRPRSGKA